MIIAVIKFYFSRLSFELLTAPGTIIVGQPNRDVDLKLIQATQEALDKAFSLCVPGK